MVETVGKDRFDGERNVHLRGVPGQAPAIGGALEQPLVHEHPKHLSCEERIAACHFDYSCRDVLRERRLAEQVADQLIALCPVQRVERYQRPISLVGCKSRTHVAEIQTG